MLASSTRTNSVVMSCAFWRRNASSVVSQKKLYSGASRSGPLLLESSACPTVNVFERHYTRSCLPPLASKYIKSEFKIHPFLISTSRRSLASPTCVGPSSVPTSSQIRVTDLDVRAFTLRTISLLSHQTEGDITASFPKTVGCLSPR